MNPGTRHVSLSTFSDLGLLVPASAPLLVSFLLSGTPPALFLPHVLVLEGGKERSGGGREDHLTSFHASGIVPFLDSALCLVFAFLSFNFAPRFPQLHTHHPGMKSYSLPESLVLSAQCPIQGLTLTLAGAQSFTDNQSTVVSSLSPAGGSWQTRG